MCYLCPKPLMAGESIHMNFSIYAMGVSKISKGNYVTVDSKTSSALMLYFFFRKHYVLFMAFS